VGAGKKSQKIYIQLSGQRWATQSRSGVKMDESNFLSFFPRRPPRGEMSSGFSFSCVCLKAEPVYTGETGHYTIYNFSLNIPTGPWQMRSNKNRTEQIPRILSPVLFCFFFLSTSQCVWLNCWTCWVALGPFPFTLYVPPEEEEEPPPSFILFFSRV
jgi:hypothetical protein